MSETGLATIRLRYFVGQSWPDRLWVVIGFFFAVLGAVVFVGPLILIPPGQWTWKATYPVKGAGIVIGFWMVRIGWREIFDAATRMKRAKADRTK